MFVAGEAQAMTACEVIQHLKADVVTVVSVAGAGISQPNDQCKFTHGSCGVAGGSSNVKRLSSRRIGRPGCRSGWRGRRRRKKFA